jgi:N,N'-diacetyllegionaminate synthase
MTARLHIAGRAVGPGEPALIIAEIGQAHDGSLGTAHSYVDAVADAGADAVKFQTHIADAESTRDEQFRVRFSTQDETRYDYWKRMEFSEAQWHDLAAHAQARGLLFLSSAFSVEALELLERVGVPAWKVGSGEYRSAELLSAMARTGKPVLLSTGMSTLAEIDQGVRLMREHGAPVALFQSTSKYPVELPEVGLNVMADLRAQHRCPVGMSIHSPTLWPAVAALALGAELVEVHVVLSRRVFGPDTGASLTVEQLTQLVEARNSVHEMLAHPVDKNAVAQKLAPMRRLFTKSLAPRVDLPAGTKLEAAMMTVKKPGTGIPPDELNTVLGKRLRRGVAADRLLRREDLDG